MLLSDGLTALRVIDCGRYDSSMSGLQVEQEVMVALAEEKLKPIKAHLDSLKADGFRQCLQEVVPVWLICIFADCLPTETVLRIMDCFFLEGAKILFRVGLTLLKLFEKPLLGCTSFEEAQALLKDGISHDKKTFACDKLFDVMFDKKQAHTRKISAAHLHQLRERIRTQTDNAQEGGGQAATAAADDGGFRARIQHHLGSLRSWPTAGSTVEKMEPLTNGGGEAEQAGSR